MTNFDRPSGITPALLAELDSSIGDVSSAFTLPPDVYTSPEVFAFEREALYAREWLCAGRAERIPEVGDWFTVTIYDEPIIVVRDKSGEVRAMSAVCQHRAMQVCDGSGNSSTFKCPYHHWNYALDGRLLGAPAMERTDDFDKADYGLPQIAVETWQGFVFVNLDPEAPPLAPTLADYEPFIANYDLADAVCPGTFTLENLPWNWKVMFENFNDGYHANRLHQYVQDFCPSHLSEFPVEWRDDSNVIFREGGYTHIDGGFNATHHAIMPVFPKLTDAERTRSTFALIPPTLCFGTCTGSVLLLPGAPDRARDDRRGDRLHLPPVRAGGSPVRVQAQAQRRRRAGVRRTGSGRDYEGATGAAVPVRATRPVLVAGGEPRAFQPLAGAAISGSGGGRRHRRTVNTMS